MNRVLNVLLFSSIAVGTLALAGESMQRGPVRDGAKDAPTLNDRSMKAQRVADAVFKQDMTKALVDIDVIDERTILLRYYRLVDMPQKATREYVARLLIEESTGDIREVKGKYRADDLQRHLPQDLITFRQAIELAAREARAHGIALRDALPEVDLVDSKLYVIRFPKPVHPVAGDLSGYYVCRVTVDAKSKQIVSFISE